MSMKKAKVIPILLIILGILFECLFLTYESVQMKLIFGLSGLIFIFAGTFGFWIYILLPLLYRKTS